MFGARFSIPLAIEVLSMTDPVTPHTPDSAKPAATVPPCPKDMDAIPVSLKAPKAPTAPAPTDKDVGGRLPVLQEMDGTSFEHKTD